MSGPFSDTSSPSTTLLDLWDQAAKLTERLGLPRNVAVRPADHMRLLFMAMNTAFDRLDAAERRIADLDDPLGPNRG
jgi:hypothetical protein